MPNRPRKQKPIRFRNRGDSPLTPATAEKRQLLLDLALELQQMTIETMEALRRVAQGANGHLPSCLAGARQQGAARVIA